MLRLVSLVSCIGIYVLTSYMANATQPGHPLWVHKYWQWPPLAKKGRVLQCSRTCGYDCVITDSLVKNTFPACILLAGDFEKLKKMCHTSGNFH